MYLFKPIIRILSAKEQRSTFLFSGNLNSGISLYVKKLPRDGYCCFGWIRAEAEDQGEKIDQNTQRQMSIFKFSHSKGGGIELFLTEKILYYTICASTQLPTVDTSASFTPASDYIQRFDRKRIEDNTWYFIELYHINSETGRGLFLYINGELIQDFPVKPYNFVRDFDEFTLGCGMAMEFTGKQGSEVLRNHFRGVMSTMHFAEVNSKTAIATHNALFKIWKGVQMTSLYPILAYSKDYYESSLELKNMIR